MLYIFLSITLVISALSLHKTKAPIDKTTHQVSVQKITALKKVPTKPTKKKSKPAVTARLDGIEVANLSEISHA